MKLKTLLVVLLLALPLTNAMAQVAHFDMSLTDGKITETVTGNSFTVVSQLPACTSAGVDGQALRFDGYSNYVKAALPAMLSGETVTASVVLAAETYPMMQVDVAETTPTYTTICGSLDETAKKGFAFELSSQGDLRLRLYVNYGGGYLVTIDGNQKLPRGSWSTLAMTFDKAGNDVSLYLNGQRIGQKKSNRCDLLHATDFMIGKSASDVKSGPFLINTFCGLIDDIRITNEVVDFTLADPTDLSLYRPDFSYPDSRYAESLWRPQFHGMPSGGWTNETHGMTYSNGRYHVFFQKNANGPYMSRLHWGHISSANLCDWTEEPIAVYPAESFDIKGCWSGCVYEDGADTYLLYTAVDNAKARIVQAKAADAGLADWTDKRVIIDGRPAGLSDDFRDPSYFEANGQKYIIVGTGKNGIGACTLHRYDNGSWTNTGDIFFQGSSAAQHGTFWEMPNVTKMADGQWLFTCTPLGMAQGVRTLCWVGSIGADGKFTAEGGVQYLEMQGIGRDGYGLLSPSICQRDGKTLLLGIVPDKLATEENYKMGWAHNYSLPREIALDANGQLVQQPYSGLSAMRTATGTSVDETLSGSRPLVSGRQIELLGEFSATTGTCGFRFLRDASLTYDAGTRRLTLDLSQLQRVSNDGGSYKGVYSATLPDALTKLHVFLDGSILDIFVNDRWAYSVRVFPTDATAVESAVFATSETAVKASSWVLDGKQTTGMHEVFRMTNEASAAMPCYNLQGQRVTDGFKGVVIKNGRKYVAR